jgi:peroxiredoxin
VPVSEVGVGDPIPDVQVWRSTSETIGLRELAGESPYLLLSYLFDWSSTCTNELSELNARRAELLDTGVTPYGISRDSPWSHVAWQQALDVEVPLLSDWTGEAVRALGIEQEFRGLPDVARRAAFVVDENGIIRGAWRYGASEVSDFDMLVEAARSLS